jgi:N-acetylmuramoyl-L-alanine amidase
MFKIALTAGHYKYEPGKRCMKHFDPNETREWVLNDRIADKVEKLLMDYDGWELIRTDDTTGERDISLDDRTNAANNFGADFYLSIHHNAGINGGAGGGIVAYVYSYPSEASLEWQKALYDALIDSTGLKGNRSAPLAKANFHECRETHMPTVLLELGFMDSSTDVPIILSEEYADQCAQAIVKVLVEKGGLSRINPPKEAEDKPAFTVKEWQEAAIADGYSFPKYGADGLWGAECESVAKEAVVKYQDTYTNKNLTRLAQMAVGVDVDGLCGKDTDHAIREYQLANGISATVDYETWKKFLGLV